MENALRGNPQDVKEQYERQIKDLQEAYGEAMLSYAREKNCSPCWATLALVIDCHTRELLGWHLSRSGRASTPSSALEHALIARFGTLGRVAEAFALAA